MGDSTCPTCRKNTYRTEGFARKVALDRSRMSDDALRVYPCPFGNGWHLTSDAIRQLPKV